MLLDRLCVRSGDCAISGFENPYAAKGRELPHCSDHPPNRTVVERASCECPEVRNEQAW